MSSLKFSPFASALKSAITKINNITSDIDKKVDIFIDEVISKIVDYDEEFFTRGGNEETDKDDMKASIKDLFKMFQPEKKKSYSGYILYCQEERNNIKERNPHLNPAQITSALGAQWKALDADEKAEYNLKAKSMKPMTDEEKAEKKAEKRASSKKPAKGASEGKGAGEKKEKVKCAYDGCDRCPKEPKEHADGKIYCAKHLNKVILGEKKSSPKSSPKSSSKKVEVEKKAKGAKGAEAGEAGELSAKEKLEKKLAEANKKLAEKTSAVSAPTGAKGAEAGKAGKPITVSPKTAAKQATIKKTTFDFTSAPKSIGENIDFWATKRVKLDKTSDKKWRYNATTGLCFEDNDDFVLAATWVDGATAWLDAIPEEVKEWARKSGCEVPADEDDDIELDGEFSDEE